MERMRVLLAIVLNVISDIIDKLCSMMDVSIITDADASRCESASRVEVSNLTECYEQKEKRANQDPSTFWKEDRSSPYDSTIINNPLVIAGEYTLDGL